MCRWAPAHPRLFAEFEFNAAALIADLWQLQQYQVAFKRERGQLRAIAPLIEQLSSSGEYGIIGFQDGVILMQKGAVSEPNFVTQWKAFHQQIEPILK